MLSVICHFMKVSPSFVFRYNTLPSRRTLKNSRLVSKKDDVHVCIMCLRAIMNYQVCVELLSACFNPLKDFDFSLSLCMCICWCLCDSLKWRLWFNEILLRKVIHSHAQYLVPWLHIIYHTVRLYLTLLGKSLLAPREASLYLWVRMDSFRTSLVRDLGH